MSNLRKFLGEALRAIDRFDEVIPIASGPVRNPLHHISQQLNVIRAHTKSYKILQNFLLAAAMLICISTTFKPIIVQQTAGVDPDEGRAWGEVLYDALARFVLNPRDGQCFNSPFMKSGNGGERSSPNGGRIGRNEVERHTKTTAPIPPDIAGHPLFHARACQHSL
jgi:hypothetical protein